MPTNPQSFTEIISQIFHDFISLLASLTGRAVTSANGTTVITKPTITEDQAITQALATETKLNPRDLSSWYHIGNPQWHQEIDTFTIFAGWNPGATCGGVSSPPISLQQAASLGETGLGVGLTAAGVAIPAIVSSAVIPGVGAVIAIVAAILEHHREAVARDNRAECALIPASNNVFQVAITGVKNGTLTPAQGDAMLAALPQQFLQAAGPAKNNSPFCNALCEYLIRVRAICFYWQSQFQSME